MHLGRLRVVAPVVSCTAVAVWHVSMYPAVFRWPHWSRALEKFYTNQSGREQQPVVGRPHWRLLAAPHWI